MKKLVILLVVLITLAFTVPVTAKDKRNKGPQRDRGRYEQNDRGHGSMHRGDGYRYKYYGHRQHHDQGRHRGNYRGHWRSWDSWKDHHRDHRRDYREGRYYRENGQLYFEFENDDGRFVFSIGR